LLLLVVAIVLFTLAGLVVALGGTIGVAPLALAFFGLASFAAAFAVGQLPSRPV
jgi:hypothetical protein